jgi:hypothetical protein
MKALLFSFLLLFSAITSSFAQKVTFDKKTGLISVNGAPSFYLIGRQRAVFQADFSLENLQHRELAYLKVLQQRIFSPIYGFTTETFYVMNFTESGNYCEIHGLPGFSMFKALGREIVAARLVQGDRILPQAEQHFIRVNGGRFRNERNGNRGNDDRYNNRTADDDRYNNRGDDRNNGYSRATPDDKQANQKGNNSNQANDPPLPAKVSIEHDRIYDNDAWIGTYTQSVGQAKGAITLIIKDTENKKVATAKRTNENADWRITLPDDTTFTLKFNKESPLVSLFTSLVERQYL